MTRVFYKSLERIFTLLAVIFLLNSAAAIDSSTGLGVEALSFFEDSSATSDLSEDGVYVVCYRDQDGDGYGNPLLTLNQLSCGGGWVANNQDCNDNNATTNPAASEVCNFSDDDCDGATDEDFLPVTIYGDFDGDGDGSKNSVMFFFEKNNERTNNNKHIIADIKKKC